MDTRHGSRGTALVLIAAAASWGLGTVISKRAVEEIPPLTLLPIQLGSSLAVLLVALRRQGGSLRRGSGAPILGRLGLLNPGLAYALSLLGLASISASLSVLLWAIEPILILAFAGWFLREPVTASLVGLSAVALVGIALVLYDPSGSGQWLGVALTIAGVACCATYTVIARRWLGTADSTVHVVAVQQSYALVLALGLLGGFTIAAGAFRLPAVSLLGWISAIASGVLYYAGAYWFYLTGLRAARATIAAAAFYLIPVFGVTGGVVLLGDRLDSRQWVGVVIVVAAVIAIALQQSRPARVRT